MDLQGHLAPIHGYFPLVAVVSVHMITCMCGSSLKGSPVHVHKERLFKVLSARIPYNELVDI